MSTLPPLLATLFLFLASAAPPPAAADASADCSVRRIKSVRGLASCAFAAETKAAKKGQSADYERCLARYAKLMLKAEAACSAESDDWSGDATGAVIEELVAAASAAARAGTALDLSALCGSDTEWDAASALCVATGDSGGGGGGTELPGGLSSFSFDQEVDGSVVSRTWQMDVPDSPQEGVSYPVLFALHGNGGTGDAYSGKFSARVDAGDFVGIYPDGHLQSWNLGREQSTADDVAFLQAIIAELAEYDGLDLGRVFILGGSNGAGMAHKFATETDLVHGIAAIVTSLLEGAAPAADSKAVGVIQVLGTADPAIPYEGGEGVAGHVFMAGEESAEAWALANSCTTPGTETTTAEGNIRIEWSGCTDDLSVVHYGIVGAGHGFPPPTEGGVDDLAIDFLLGLP